MTFRYLSFRGAAVPVALVMLLILGACGGSSSEPSFGTIDWPDDPSSVSAEPGSRAPNFHLETSTGSELTLSDEMGQPILLNFFASWCLNCREEMAALDTFDGDEVKVIGINLRESEGTVNQLADETGASFAMSLDRNGEVSREYRATSLPVTLLLDEDGTVIEYIRGPVDEEQIEELLGLVGSG